jgi:hypothetical protein
MKNYFIFGCTKFKKKTPIMHTNTTEIKKSNYNYQNTFLSLLTKEMCLSHT